VSLHSATPPQVLAAEHVHVSHTSGHQLWRARLQHTPAAVGYKAVDGYGCYAFFGGPPAPPAARHGVAVRQAVSGHGADDGWRRRAAGRSGTHLCLRLARSV
jgi:hypothetical protein